jgi:hypothetical protein
MLNACALKLRYWDPSIRTYGNALHFIFLNLKTLTNCQESYLTYIHVMII